MSPEAETRHRLADLEGRLRAKGLFVTPGDALSLRVPGQREMLLRIAGTDEIAHVSFEGSASAEASLHQAIYRARPDAGGVLAAESTWADALSTLGEALPGLFDEQARHLGPMQEPVARGGIDRIVDALRSGGNALTAGSSRIVIGTTPNRVALNADLFEKCAKAFVIAHAGGPPIRTLPLPVEARWHDRLRSDQARAARSYAEGRIPEGMDAY